MPLVSGRGRAPAFRRVRPSARRCEQLTNMLGILAIPVAIVFLLTVHAAPTSLPITSGALLLLLVGWRVGLILSSVQAGRELTAGYATLQRYPAVVELRDGGGERVVREATVTVQEIDGTPVQRPEAESHSVGAPNISATRDLARGRTPSPAVLLGTLIAVLVALAVLRVALGAAAVGVLPIITDLGLILAAVACFLLLLSFVRSRHEARLFRNLGDNASNPPQRVAIIPALRTIELVGLLSVVRPGIKCERLVWLKSDPSGISLWSGTADEPMLAIPWDMVVALGRVRAHNDRGQSLAALGMSFRLDDVRVVQATIIPTRTGTWSSVHLPDRDLGAIVARIRAVTT